MRIPLPVLVLVAACRDASPPTGGPPVVWTSTETPSPSTTSPTLPVPLGPPCAWAEDCVDVTAVPPKWGFVPGWRFAGVKAVDDLTGDGVADLWIEVLSPEDIGRSLLLSGPGDRALVLPDAAYAYSDGFAAPIPDVSGDGLADLSLDGHLVAGPVEPGELTTDGALAQVDGFIDEVNGDGIGDLVVDNSDRVWVWTGPYSSPAGPPDVTLLPSCTPDGGSALYGGSVPDLTGDGAPELYLPGSWGYDSCGGWMLSAPASGTVDPATADDVWFPAHLLSVVGDQSGDGWRDVLTADTLQLGPFSFAGGALAFAEEQPIDVDHLGGTPLRLPGDLDADGTGELATAGSVGLASMVSVWSGGLSGGLFGAPPVARYGLQRPDARWGAFVEDGHLLLAMSGYDDLGVILVDLGAASERSPTE
jgi:hypothetical protein